MNRLDTLSVLLKALSEPLRLRIMALLNEAGELCVCDLVTILGASQSMVSRHLAYLRGAGWVESRREGLWMHYRILRTNHPAQNGLLETLRAQTAEDDALRDDLAKLKAMEPASACHPGGRCC